MAAEILLEINGHKYNASGFSYDFYQVPDFKGKPVTGLEGGDIHVVLESNADNSLLETMLSDKSRQVPYHSWPDFEPAPICGKIQLIRDDVEVFRELVFEEGYIYRYYESMTADGFPMSILLSISTMRLDINRNVRLDRRLLTTYGFGWTKYVEKEIPKMVAQSDEELSTKITDAYWIDEQGKKHREFIVDFPVTLYVQFDRELLGQLISLEFKIFDNGELRHAQCSGFMNKDRIMVVENFKFE